jgi:hypothetical protein
MLAMMGTDELAYQMALDRVEHDEFQARQQGVPTATETLATPPAKRIGRQDPDWFQKLEAAARR